MDLVVRTAVIFVFILLVTRIVGRRELGVGEPFDLILLVVLGDLVQQGITQNDTSVTGTLLVVSTLALLTLFLSLLSYHVRPFRSVVEGEPVVLVQDGKPLHRNLRRERIAIDEVLAAARLQQVGALDEIRWAIAETTGQISIIPRRGGES